MSRVAVLPPTDALEHAASAHAPSPASAASTSAAASVARAASAAVDSVALFAMGYAAEAVGRALVEARGHAPAALEILKRAAAPAVAEPADAAAADDDEAKQLELAIQMSLEQPTESRPSKAPRSASAGANPLWAPPRYLPKARDVEAGPRTLNLIEQVQVRDGGYAYQRASAFLDTGNQAMTLVSTAFAARHAIYKEEPNIPSLTGSGGSRFGQAERWTTIRGVVPGASTSAPVVTIALKIRDQEMLVPAAVSDPGGQHDLLLGADVIGKLFEAGYRLGAGSM